MKPTQLLGKVAQLVGLAGGVWLMAAPAALGYVDTTAGEVQRTIGPLLATFAIIALWEVTVAVRLVNLPLAAVLALSPLVGDHPGPATVVALATAAAVAAATRMGGRGEPHQGGGWRAAFSTQARS